MLLYTVGNDKENSYMSGEIRACKFVRYKAYVFNPYPANVENKVSS